jgi:hypothetical protein
MVIIYSARHLLNDLWKIQLDITSNLARLAPREDASPISDLEVHISSLCEFARAALPEDYLAFLRLSGRGLVFPENRIDIGLGRYNPGVDSLFGFGCSRNSLGNAIGAYDGRLPPEVIPIGKSGGGDLICLGTGPGNSGVVYRWNHEGEVDRAGNRLPDYSNMVELARSFSSMLDLMQIVPPDTSPLRVTKSTLRF